MNRMLYCPPIRRYFMHPAHRTIGLIPALASRPREPIPATDPLPETRPSRVGWIAGEEETWDASAGILTESLAESGRLECFPAWEDADFGADDAADYDCLVLIGWPGAAGSERMKQIERHCRGGGALVALRSTHGAMPGWSSFAEDVLGGRDRGPHARRRLVVERSQKAWYHPVLEDVAPFLAHAETYQGPRLAPDSVVLLVGQSGGRECPVAWVRRHRGGRIFSTTLGSAADFGQPSFVRLLCNAVRWAAVVHDV
jgi:hypothetical protein